MTRLLFAAVVICVVLWLVQAVIRDIRKPPMPFWPPVNVEDLRT